ncbi:hypothetical protein [Tepidicaulis sp.]|uniref:hypothetical protein n=1 Tax=Tepidicaulis sp. TaxID=1920809 RepID=UPI003B5CE796
MLSYLINIALLCALLACTTYMYFVNQRLRLLRSGQDNIGPMIEKFAKITGDMTESLSTLKSDAVATARQLEEIVSHAHALNGKIETTLKEAKAIELRLTAANALHPAAQRSPAQDESIEGLTDLLKAFEEEVARRPENKAKDAPVRADQVQEAPPRPLHAVEPRPALGFRARQHDEEGEKGVRRWKPAFASKKSLMNEALDLFYKAPGDA